MSAKCGNHLMDSSYRDGEKIFDFCVRANFLKKKCARTAISITTYRGVPPTQSILCCIGQNNFTYRSLLKANLQKSKS